MVDSAWQLHKWIGGRAEDFFGVTKAITVAFNGESVKVYAHHMQPAVYPRDIMPDGQPLYQYHQVPIFRHDLDTYQSFLQVVKGVRNAQDIGYDLALGTMDLLWDNEVKRGQMPPPSEAGSSSGNYGYPASEPQANVPTPSASRSGGSSVR